jgi:hypothetical protein
MSAAQQIGAVAGWAGLSAFGAVLALVVVVLVRG